MDNEILTQAFATYATLILTWSPGKQASARTD
jgi:hypothetical protein